MRAYLLVSLAQPVLQGAAVPPPPDSPLAQVPEHRWWDEGQGWKSPLNNLRLILQPFMLSCLILPWLLGFEIPPLPEGFHHLIALMNCFHASLPT